jgi:hypothetical protein
MIIKVVELSRTDEFTCYDEVQSAIKKDQRYTLIERFLNIDHIVSFREADPGFYNGVLPEDLSEGQQFTYVHLSESRKGITIIDSPSALQLKINKLSGASDPSLIRG